MKTARDYVIPLWNDVTKKYDCQEWERLVALVIVETKEATIKGFARTES